MTMVVNMYTDLTLISFTKYYKSLFIGLVDMVLVNAYIIRNIILKKRGSPPVDHFNFFKSLQDAMVTTTKDKFDREPRDVVSGNQPRAGLFRATSHIVRQTKDMRENGGQQRARHRACKVCSQYKVRVVV